MDSGVRPEAQRNDLLRPPWPVSPPDIHCDPPARPNTLTAWVGATFFRAAPVQALVQDCVLQALPALQEAEGLLLEVINPDLGQCPSPCFPPSLSSDNAASSRKPPKVAPAPELCSYSRLWARIPRPRQFCRPGFAFSGVCGLEGWGATPAINSLLCSEPQVSLASPSPAMLWFSSFWASCSLHSPLSW